jgi:molecular chaperone DnaK (HSP70)
LFHTLLTTLACYRYSGVAWSWSGNPNPNMIDQISTWENTTNENNRDSDKVPSRIIYDRQGKVVGWGFTSKPDKTCIQLKWFKLLLSDEARKNGREKLKEVEVQLAALKKTPVRVVADYLKRLWDHAVKMIKRKITSSAFDNMELRIVVTVPANWDLAAQRRTKEAVELAGITASRFRGVPSLKLVTEPESAALDAWTEGGLRWQPNLKVRRPPMLHKTLLIHL